MTRRRSPLARPAAHARPSPARTSSPCPPRPRPGGAALRARLVALVGSLSLVAASLVAAGPAWAAPTPVTEAVDADAPAHHWRLGEAADGAQARVALDRAGSADLALPASAVRGVPGATADGDAATTFLGGAAGGDATTAVLQEGPQSFSLEAWLRTTTTTGGKILGLENEAEGYSTSYDRHLWMDVVGRVSFGVHDGGPETVRTPGALNDGGWHHVVATYGDATMRLFVDGTQVAARTGVSAAQRFDGYWRVGGGRLGGGWPDQPSTTSFSGDLDDVAVYPAPLAADRVAAHHVAATGVAALAAAPPAAPEQPGDERRSDFGSYRPGPATTGSYGALRRHEGDLTITTPGQVVEGLDVTGVLRIRADDVTVRRTTVRGGDRGPGYRGAILMALAGDQRGAVIEDVTVRPSHPVVGMNAIQVSEATVRRADVSGATDGIVAYGDDVTVEGSWVHGLVRYSYDPTQDDGSHGDALQVEGGARTAVVGNSLSGGSNASVQVTQNHARVRGLVVDRNHLGGGRITLNTSEKGRGAYTGFRLTDNLFAGDETNTSGVQAVITATTRARAVVEGNVVEGTGEPITVVDAGS